jgi:hypothetical protein
MGIVVVTRTCVFVGARTMLQVGRLQVRFLMRSLDFSIDLILPASNRNEYQESSWW